MVAAYVLVSQSWLRRITPVKSLTDQLMMHTVLD